jgi:NDP-sugar pyrophosphorylase family protein
MAGGDGARMRQSGIDVRKPLVLVLGVTLLERNLWMLAKAGCRHVAIATSFRAGAEEKYFTDDLVRRAASIGILVEVFVEEQPLGNFGAASLLSGRGQTIVVVFADNLTTLNLDELVRAHHESNAALTLAAHEEFFRMPYGELRARPDNASLLQTYIEKPSYDMTVSSGIAVISAEALELVPRKSAIGLSNVSNMLIDAGLSVYLCRHASPWIDANDSSAVRAAASLVRQERATFERWWAGPIVGEGVLTLASTNGLLVPFEWFVGIAKLQNYREQIWTFDVLTGTGVVRVHAILTAVGLQGGCAVPQELAAHIAARLEANPYQAQGGS